ncbi:hypothetical protein ILUMI_05455 [Ignelater luminosus]|uniref:GH18 domain-containing protein n=1 Tax=Ignelater luminosus TaxID=2038154 RepID=A0A8K0DHN0_IGNLU|nr:hypothetical protein ILUMI_05455 [Ignelater luminosus]
MGCIWTLELDSPSNITEKHLYFHLKTTNRFGTTQVNQTYSQSQAVGSYNSSENCLYIVPANTTHPSSTSIVDQKSPYKVVCYVEVPNTRRSEAKINPLDNIDYSLCTHLVYLDADIDTQYKTLELEYSSLKTASELHRQLTNLRTKGVKILLGFSGWAAYRGIKYSNLINDRVARKQFAINAAGFLEKHNFDGFELRWFYPKDWEIHDYYEPDKIAFAEFVKELHAVFTQKRLLLSLVVPREKRDIDACYDLSTLSGYLDWITMNTVVYYRRWRLTAHTAPLYSKNEDKYPTANINFTVYHIMEKVEDKSKLLLRVSVRGELYSLLSTADHGLNAKTINSTFVSYYEMCNLMDKQWTVVQDPEKRKGPYAYFNTKWITFDDPAMARHKSEYVKNMGLGGVGIYIQYDDFNNTCSCESYPMLNAVNRVLRNYRVSDPNCQFPPI